MARVKKVKASKEKVEAPEVKKEVKSDYDLARIFNFEIAGYSKPLMQESKPLYTKIMKGIWGKKSKVLLMAPEVYLKHSYSKTDVTKEELRNPRIDLDNLNPKWALPYIDIRNKTGLGRGRALVCLKKGIKEIPVLVVGKKVEDIDAWLKENKITAKEF